MKKDIYIAILEYGKEKGLLGVTYHEIYEHLQSRGYITSTELNEFKENKPSNDVIKEKQTQINRLFEESFPASIRHADRFVRLLSMESYFKLIEYIEIVEARENASSAKFYSLIAIALAAITLLGSIAIAYYQSQQELVMSNLQFDSLSNQKYDDNMLINKINTLIEVQSKSLEKQNDVNNNLIILNKSTDNNNKPNKTSQHTPKNGAAEL